MVDEKPFWNASWIFSPRGTAFFCWRFLLQIQAAMSPPTKARARKTLKTAVAVCHEPEPALPAPAVELGDDPSLFVRVGSKLLSFGDTGDGISGSSILSWWF